VAHTFVASFTQQLSSGRRYVVLECVLDQLGVRSCSNHFHYAVFVKRHGSGREVEDRSYFFHGSAFGQQLQDFRLASC
jgi:hypothetical protein